MVHGVIPPWMQDFAVCKARVFSLPRSPRMSAQPAGASASPPNFFISKLAEGSLDPTIRVTNEDVV